MKPQPGAEGPGVAFTPSTRYPDPAIEVLDPAFLKLRLFSASVEQLASGCRWAEGPQWFSPAAQADLLDIALYIAQDNPTRALSFVDELEAKRLQLGQVSGIGTARPELGDDLSMLPHGNYLIFYCDQEFGLRFERVKHVARDIGGDVFDADR